MTADELKRRQAILEELDTAAYECCGCLRAMVDTGATTHPTALRVVARFRKAWSDFEATQAVDRAAG